MSPQIKFKLLHPDAKLPTRAHDSDACFDVVATSREVKDEYIEYGLGFATEMPAGWEGHIYSRSSVSNKDLLLCNGTARIDAGYRGEWMVRFKLVAKLGLVPVQPFRTGPQLMKSRLVLGKLMYEVGDRVAQIQFRRLDQYELVLADELSDTQRGAGGFGSTGK